MDGERLTVQAAYDLLGRPDWIRYPDGEQVQYRYDRAGRLSGVDGYVRQIVYNAMGQMVHSEYVNNTVTDYEYDRVGQELSPAAAAHDGGRGSVAGPGLHLR